MLVLSPTFHPLLLMQVCMVHIVLELISGANDPGFRCLDSSMKDRHVGLKIPKSKFSLEELIAIAQCMDI